MIDAAKFWNGMAKQYSASPIADMDSYEYTLGRTKSYLGAEDRVLELGAGTSSTALLIAPGVGHIHATDLAGEMIAIGEEKARAEGVTNISFARAGVFDDISEGPFDAVLAFNLLHLIDDQKGAIERAHALLKPGGYFISKSVCKPGKGLPWKMKLMMLALPLAQRLGKAPFVKFSEIAELEAMITDTGFEIVETGNFPAQPPSRYVVARKTV